MVFSAEEEGGIVTFGKSLPWSRRLQTNYRYLPANPKSLTLKLPYFDIAPSVHTLTVEVRPWSEQARDENFPVEEVVLRASISGRPAIIFGQEA